MFTEPIVTEQVMYIWRQTLLQTGNVEDNVALAILHISSFLISWAQGAIISVIVPWHLYETWFYAKNIDIFESTNRD